MGTNAHQVSRRPLTRGRLHQKFWRDAFRGQNCIGSDGAVWVGESGANCRNCGPSRNVQRTETVEDPGPCGWRCGLEGVGECCYQCGFIYGRQAQCPPCAKGELFLLAGEACNEGWHGGCVIEVDGRKPFDSGELCAVSAVCHYLDESGQRRGTDAGQRANTPVGSHGVMRRAGQSRQFGNGGLRGCTKDSKSPYSTFAPNKSVTGCSVRLLGFRWVLLCQPHEERGYSIGSYATDGGIGLLVDRPREVRIDIARPVSECSSLVRWLFLRSNDCSCCEAECPKPNASAETHGRKLRPGRSAVNQARTSE